MLPPEVASAVGGYLATVDRLLPSRVVGFYVVGSVALGAFRPDRSDIDFVAVVDRDLTVPEIRRLRLVHAVAGARSVVRGARHRRFSLPGTLNGVFVRREDLSTPVTAIEPVASHTAQEFHVGRGFDVNPVVWKVLRDRGIGVRGPSPSELGLVTEPERLDAWNRENLRSYWRPWAEALGDGRSLRLRFRPRWLTAWGVLGPPRLHCTIETGDVVSKEGGAEYALAIFDERWHPIIREALAYVRGAPADPAFRDVATRMRHTTGFVLEVVDSVNPA